MEVAIRVPGDVHSFHWIKTGSLRSQQGLKSFLRHG
jgi:hypothetical protein